MFLLFKQEQFIELFDNPQIANVWMTFMTFFEQQQSLLPDSINTDVLERVFKSLDFANDLKLTGEYASWASWGKGEDRRIRPGSF